MATTTPPTCRRTFDDSAAASAPDGVLGSGTYKPTNLSNGFTGDLWPAPAPAAPYAATFAAFNGTNPNGTWNLYLVDDASGDIGTLSGGWTLHVETGVAVFPGSIQLSNVEYRGTEGAGVATVTIDRVSGDDGIVGVSLRHRHRIGHRRRRLHPGHHHTSPSPTARPVAPSTCPSRTTPRIEGIDELIPLTLSAPTGGATLGSPTSGQIRLQDNDARANAFPITIPATGPTLGASDPYPSNIVVAGASGVVTDVDVTLTNVSHTHIRDLDVLLVAPNGTTTLLMQDVGPNTPVNNLNLIFSDEAAGGISQASLTLRHLQAVRSSTTSSPTLPGAGPRGSLGHHPRRPRRHQPNGTWSLYVVDDAGGDIGQIAGGWSLTLDDRHGQRRRPVHHPRGLRRRPSPARPRPTVGGATYEWDVDGDGQYDDATGQTPTVSAGTLASIGLGDGPDSSSVRVRVTAGLGRDHLERHHADDHQRRPDGDVLQQRPGDAGQHRQRHLHRPDRPRPRPTPPPASATPTTSTTTATGRSVTAPTPAAAPRPRPPCPPPS